MYQVQWEFIYNIYTFAIICYHFLIKCFLLCDPARWYATAQKLETGLMEWVSQSLQILFAQSTIDNFLISFLGPLPCRIQEWQILNSTLEIGFHEDKWIAILLVGIGDVLRRWFLHNAYLNFWGKLSSVWSKSGFGWASLRPLAALFRWAGKQGGCGMPRHPPRTCCFGVMVKQSCLLLWESFLFNLVIESAVHF